MDSTHGHAWSCGLRCRTTEADMTLDDAVYMTALEEEDLGTEEGEDPADEDPAASEDATETDTATGDESMMRALQVRNATAVMHVLSK